MERRVLEGTIEEDEDENNSEEGVEPFRIAEQSPRQRNIKGGDIVLELERRVLNNSEQEQEKETTNNATVAPYTNEEDEMMAAGERQEQDERKELKEEQGLVAADKRSHKRRRAEVAIDTRKDRVKRVVSYEELFNEKMEKLRQYKKQHFTVNVSLRIDKQLNSWLYYQKVKHNKGTLTKEHVLLLEDEGVDLKFNCKPNQRCKFEEQAEKIREYKKQHCTANVSQSIDSR